MPTTTTTTRNSDDDDANTTMSSSDDTTSYDAGSCCSPLSLDTTTPIDKTTTSAAASSSSPSLRDFEIVRRIGSGDIGNVYLCRLIRDEAAAAEQEDKECYYAMKVVDKEVIAAKRKTRRAETERRIMRAVDHPFLPTLYAEFDAVRFSCIVMEFCPGGDLLSLRDKQPFKRFSITHARFYAAEVLVALEYLHMLGIIYRDLKPENVLVRSDGHIMLTDFDLSLCSHSIPALHSSSTSSPHPTAQNTPSPTNTPYQTRPDQTRFGCFPIRFTRPKTAQTPNNSNTCLFVAEPVSARSCSFVGTHEYVSPEVAAGGSHGSAVDWWSFGIFLYELIYGRTPFAGDTNESTLRNILKKPLTFPTHAPCSIAEAHARDLISKLLVKDPAGRLGSTRGAADVRVQPFFKELNFALVRSMRPPVVPGSGRKVAGKVKGGSGSSSPFSYF